MIRFPWGELQLTVLDGGSLWLDGGSMFGVVPKPLWEKEREPDERNRIRLAMNLLLIDDGRTRTLVDTGVGDDWDDRTRQIYNIDSRSAAALLEPAGLRPEQIDRVISTHLHFDHAGGNTRLGGAGEWVPSFPNAVYVMQRGELETARMDNERIRAAFMEQHYEPLASEPERVELVEGDVELDAGIVLEVAPGHTPYMQMVLVRGAEGTVGFVADLVPTASHVRYPYIMAYDLEPLATLQTKRRVLPRAVSEGWRVVFEHDPLMPLATLVERQGRIVAEPCEAEA